MRVRVVRWTGTDFVQYHEISGLKLHKRSHSLISVDFIDSTHLEGVWSGWVVSQIGY